MNLPVSLPDDAALLRALSTVIDPEAGIDIVALGLVYGMVRDERGVSIDLTMTSPACPMGEMIVDEARAALAGLLPPEATLAVRLVWDPPWTPARMSDAARRHFGWTPDDGDDR